LNERKATYRTRPAREVTAAEFRLPLPPTSNHQYEPILRRVKDGRTVHGKRWSDEYQAWRDEVALIVKGWQPAARVPLAVSIDLYIPTKLGRNCDIDGFVKPLLDATVGKHCDQYVDYLRVRRQVGDGHAEIIIASREYWCD